jgi:serine phosphatase RsbU (regulator of sigma subunit)
MIHNKIFHNRIRFTQILILIALPIVLILINLNFAHNDDKVNYLLFQIIGVFIIMLVILLFEYRLKKLKVNCQNLEKKELAAREILNQRNSLSSRNREFEESLRYANRIQRAMLTTDDEVHRLFPESFIFQLPKDIVSGDFYWAKEIDGSVFFSVADCTGHGVPGAFMSLIGLEFFRQIVVERGFRKPSSVLSEMNSQFNKVFEKHDDFVLKDGIDLSFCAFHIDRMELEFSGAFHSLYIIRNNEILEIKGDRKSVGPSYGLEDNTFTNQLVKLEEDDIIYMFSDGYPDQFGGPEGKKFKYRRFRHLLLYIQKFPMEEQQKILHDYINKWMGELNQIDDITIVGIKPSSYSLIPSEIAVEDPSVLLAQIN